MTAIMHLVNVLAKGFWNLTIVAYKETAKVTVLNCFSHISNIKFLSFLLVLYETLHSAVEAKPVPCIPHGLIWIYFDCYFYYFRSYT